MLKTEQIVKNTKKFFQTAESHGVMNDKLLNLLGEDFVKAPATTSTSQYNAFEGGLVDHILNVTKYAVIFNNALPESERVDQKSLIRVCLLHLIGKAKLYKPNTSDWHLKQGNLYQYDEHDVSMRISERSLFYATSSGVELTEEEFSVILMSDKIDDKMTEFYNTRMGYLLRSATTFAILNEKG